MKRGGGITQQQNRSLSKCIVVLGCLVFMMAGPALADWEPVGTPGFSTGVPGWKFNLDLNASGVPYVAYSDQDTRKATVMKFEANTWQVVGTPGVSAGETSEIGLVLGDGSVPYVTYVDWVEGEAVVMKFEGGVWQRVGAPGFSSGEKTTSPSLALDSNGTPYVVYQDEATGWKATVEKFENGSWQIVGTPGFSSGDRTFFPNLALAPDDTPYVVYQDAANNIKATVMKFEDDMWQIVGQPGFSAGGILYPQLAIDRDGIPYVAYQDLANNSKVTVMKLEGGTWETVGTPGFSTMAALEPGLALDSNGTPYVAYPDWANDGKATVMTFDGGTWRAVGTAGFSAGRAGDHMSLGLNANGVLYVAYRDDANDGKVTVMKFVEDDSDGDGVPDDQDACPGSDDSVDVDGDQVPDGCDLVITKTQSFTDRGNNSVYIGDSIFYTLTVSNFLDLPFLQLQITDLLDEGLTYLSGDTGISVDSANLLTYEAGIVEYGDSFTLSFSVSVDSDAVVGNSIDNTAGLSRYLEDNTGGPIPIEESNTVSVNIGRADSTVPEPGTVILFGLGLLGVLGTLRRNRQRRK